MKNKTLFLFCFLTFIFTALCFAYHPLITDDSGTQGAGNFQFEFNVEYGRDSEEGVTTEETLLNTTITCGLVDTIDIALSIPYLFIKEINNEITKANGLSDLSIDIKYRFYENNGFNLAIKPGFTIPTGEEEKGFGTGKTTERLFFIMDREFESVTLFFNAGYIRNENKVDERKDLWHVSLAGEYRGSETIKLTANVGTERNTERESSENPIFFICGLVCSITENLELDAGVKVGINTAETDYTLMAGITQRF